jgi:arsenate reductase
VGFEEFTDVQAGLANDVDPLAAEFDGIYERAQIERVVAESAKQLEGAAVASFIPILAHRFARERLRAQAQAEGKLAKDAPEIVFVSITGGGRARMAASLLERLTGDSANIHTAGSGTERGIDPNVRVAMEELGIDLTEKFTRPITAEVLASADVVVTMGRSVGEVEIPDTARHVDWRVGDPTGAELEEVRRVRDDIERRVTELAENLHEPIASARTASAGQAQP